MSKIKNFAKKHKTTILITAGGVAVASASALAAYFAVKSGTLQLNFDAAKEVIEALGHNADELISDQIMANNQTMIG